MGLTWIDPPATIGGRGGGLTAEAAQRLLDDVAGGDAQWALVKTGKSPSTAGMIRARIRKVLGPKALDKFEVVGRKIDDETRAAANVPEGHRYGVWMRSR